MFKKMLIIGLLLVVIFTIGMFASVYRPKGKVIKDVKLKKRIMDFLIEKDAPYIKDIDNNLNSLGVILISDQKKYKDYEIYRVSYDLGMIIRLIVLKKGNKLYIMPRDFNKLLVESNNLATKENELKIAEKYVEFSAKEEVIIEKSERGKFIRTIKTQGLDNKIHIEKEVYDIQIISWEKVNGVRIRWYFTFKDGQIYRYAAKVLDIFSGDYFRDEDLMGPYKGEGGAGTFRIIKRESERTESVSVKNYSGEEITFSDYEPPNDVVKYRAIYVTVKDNGVAKPANERTVTIELRNFAPSSDVEVKVTIKAEAITDTLLNRVITVDESGNADYNWEIPADVHTGKCKITANGGDPKYFFIYRSRSGALPGELNYDYHILYGDQFASFN